MLFSPSAGGPFLLMWCVFPVIMTHACAFSPHTSIILLRPQGSWIFSGTSDALLTQQPSTWRAIAPISVSLTSLASSSTYVPLQPHLNYAFSFFLFFSFFFTNFNKGWNDLGLKWLSDGSTVVWCHFQVNIMLLHSTSLLQSSRICSLQKCPNKHFSFAISTAVSFAENAHPRGVYFHLVALSLKKIANSDKTVGEKLQKNINNSKTPRRLVSRKCLRTARRVRNSSWGIVNWIVASTIICRTRALAHSIVS